MERLVGRIFAGIICAALLITDGNTIMSVQAYTEAPETEGSYMTVEQEETDTECSISDSDEESRNTEDNEFGAEGEVLDTDEDEPDIETPDREEDYLNTDMAVLETDESGDYLVYEIVENYRFRDITVEPESYSAKFHVTTKGGAENLRDVWLLYTSDEETANDFFKGVSSVEEGELRFKKNLVRVPFRDLKWTQEKNGSDVNMTLELGGETGLKPNTTYYYRWAAIPAGTCKFWTVPEAFTTKAPITESFVKIKNVSVEETGYQRAKIVWEIENPNQEYLALNWLYFREETGEYNEKDRCYAYEFKDDSGNAVPGKYYTFLDLSKAGRAKVILETMTGNGEKKRQESEELSLTPKDISGHAQITETITSLNYAVSLELLPCYTVDENYLQLYYRKKGDDSYRGESKPININSENVGRASITMNALERDVTYEYYITVAGRAVKGSEEAPETFILGTKTYEDEEFPDEIFRNEVKKKLGISESEKITSDKLETLTELMLPVDQVYGNIESIQGIDKIVNLTRLDLRGHKLTGADELSGLTRLQTISMEDNDLTAMPDLSGLKSLSFVSLSGNRMAAETVSSEKLPDNFAAKNGTWVENTISSQREEVTSSLAPQYYAKDGKWPFWAKVSGLKKNTSIARTYKLSLTIGDSTVYGEETEAAADDVYRIANICSTGIKVEENKPCSALVRLSDNYGNEYLRMSTELIFMADESVIIPEDMKITPVNIAADCYGVYLQIENLPMGFLPENIEKMELLDQNGRIVGTGETEIGHFVDKSNDHGFTIGDPVPEKEGYHLYWKYTSSDVGDGTDDTEPNRIRYKLWISFDKYLSEGEYAFRLSMKDAALNLTFEKAVSVVEMKTPVLERIELLDQYKYVQHGAYLYVTLLGTNLDPSRLRPVFYTDEKPITECVEYYADYGFSYRKNAVTYKLRKLEPEKYWSGEVGDEHMWRPEADEGYVFTDLIKEKSLFIPYGSVPGDFIVYEIYNYRKGAYEAYTDGSVPDGTKVTVKYYDYWFGSFATKRGSAQGTVQDDRIVLNFKDENGNNITIGPDEVGLKYEVTWADGTKTEFKHVGYVGNGLFWYDFKSSTDGDEFHFSYYDMVLSLPSGTKMWDIDFADYAKGGTTSGTTLKLFDKDGKQRGGTVTLKKKVERGYVHLTGTWRADQGLVPGDYTIEAKNTSLDEKILHVYDDAYFYLDDQTAGVSLDETGGRIFSIGITSSQIYGNYVIRHSKRPDDSSTEKYWEEEGYQIQIFDRFGNEITGWEKDHVAWTDAAGIPVDTRINDFGAGTPGVWEWSGCYLRVYLKNIPAEYAGLYVKITRKGENGVRSDGKMYYEFMEDEWGNKPEGEGNSRYGQWHSMKEPGGMQFRRTVHRDSWYDSLVITGIYAERQCYPIKLTISTMDGRQVKQFTADEPTRGLDYVFNKTDLGGIAEDDVYQIKAESADGGGLIDRGWFAVESAGDHIPNYKLDHKSLIFDLRTGEGCSQKLCVYDGAQEIVAVTWSSTDESVAAVSKGIVTPEGAGTAKILAAVQNGPTLTCDVTVSREELTAVRIGDSSCILYVDSQGQQVKDDRGNPVSQMPNERRLKLYLTPNDTTAVSTIVWTSDNPVVAGIETAEDVPAPAEAVLTAKAKGTTKITAVVTTKSGEVLKAECAVTVKTVTGWQDVPVAKREEELEKKLEPILTNETLTLEEVIFPEGFEGWEWRYPDVSLKQFSGLHEKAFAVQYRDPADLDAEPYKTSIKVSLNTVTGIGIAGESSLHQGNMAEASVLWNIDGISYAGDGKLDMTKYVERISWSSDKPNIVTVVKEKGSQTTLQAVGAGSATIMAQAVFRDGKVYKAQAKVTVTDGDIADIQVISVDHFVKDIVETGNSETYRGNLKEGTVNLRLSVDSGTKITAKSNNIKVVAPGKIMPDAADDGKDVYLVPISVKAAGMAVITLTANDRPKTSKEIRLYVTDGKPNISQDSLTVNLWQTTGTAFFLYPNKGYQIKSAALTGEDASKFILEEADGPGAYVLKAKDGTLQGNYKLSIEGKVTLQGQEDFDYDSVACKVKVVNQAPKYKLKQEKKINLFYKKTQSRLLLTSDEILEKADLTQCDFRIVPAEGSTGDYIVQPGRDGLTTSSDTQGVLELTFQGWRPVTVNYKVSVEKKAPNLKLSAQNVTLYPEIGLDQAEIALKNGKTDYDADALLTGTLSEEAETAGLKLSPNGNRFLLNGSAMAVKRTVRAKISFLEEGWAEPIELTCTVKSVSGKPVVKLGKGTLQLNAEDGLQNYEAAATEVMWKSGAQFLPQGVSVSASDARSRTLINSGIVFTYDSAAGKIIVRLHDDGVEKGSYKFKVNVRVTDTLTVTAPLNVKIVKVAKEKAVKISTRGSIDVLNRQGTFVTVLPKLQSLNGTVVDVRLTGRAAHLFEASCENGNVVIHAKEKAALITKYLYKMKLNLTVENTLGDKMQYQTSEIGIKLKQGRPKVMFAPKNLIAFCGVNNDMTVAVASSLKGVDNLEIEKVELINVQNVFTGVYDQEGGTLTLRNTDEIIKGRNYSLQFRVIFAEQADNEKPVIVKIPVKIK